MTIKLPFSWRISVYLWRGYRHDSANFNVDCHIKTEGTSAGSSIVTIKSPGARGAGGDGSTYKSGTTRIVEW